MALQKDRKRIFVSGLGKMSVREIEPTPGATFLDVGYLGGSVLNRELMQEEVMNEDGFVIDVLTHSEKCQLSTQLHQTSIDEINLIKNASSKVYAVRYDGVLNRQKSHYQYYSFEQARILASIERSYEVGLKPLPMISKSIKKAELAYDVPLFYLVEANGELFIDRCNLWLDARQGLNSGTVYLLDHSGFARHGVLTATSLWQTTTTPERFIRLNGTNQSVNMGNILNDDGSADFAIECWLRIPAADGTTHRLLAKKSALSDNTAGFMFYRGNDNKIVFKLSSGAASVMVASSSSVLQNAWTHIMVAIDRNGNGQIYLNGAANGSAVSVAAIGTGTNALNYYVGRDNAEGFGQIDIAMVRHHLYGADLLPSNIASIVLSHYNAEKAYYGL